MRALRAVVAGVFGLLVALGTVVLGAVWSAPPAAAAADPQSWVSIRFTAMTPSLPTRTANDTITLQGVVTNTSKVDLSNLQAIFWRSLDPIQDSDGMAAALGSAANEPLGLRVNKLGHYENIPSETDRTLAPGESTSFSVSAKVSDLNLPPIDAIYLLGIHVRGRLTPYGPDITLGRGRVFAPVVDTPPQNAAQLSTLVVLDSRPSLVRRGVFADDHLAAELGPDGRLTALLQAADNPDNSFVVDPSLIEEVQTMRAGYQVLQPDGTTVAGTGGSDATRWLIDYTRIAQTHSGFRELYGHPDVSALVHAGMSSVIDGGELAAKAVTTTSALPLLAIPAGGQADQQTVDVLAGLKPDAIVLDDSTTGQDRPLLKGPDGIRLLNTAATSFSGGPGPEPSDTAVQVRQQTLAETWLDADSAKPDDTIGQLRIIKTLAQARGNAHQLTAPWLEREPLSQLLDSTPAGWSQQYHYSASAAGKELTGLQIDGVGRLVTGYQTMADLLARPSDVELDAGAAAARSASIAWRSKPDLWTQFVHPQQAALDDVRLNAVKIITTPRVVTSAHSVYFPVTVRNTLAAVEDDPLRNTIKVKLEFSSANGQRLTVTPSSDMADGLQVPAGAGVTGNAQVDAQANGIVKVTAQAYTLSGTPVGEPMPIEVKATQAGTIGWLIAIAAGVVLVGSSALRIHQVTKERAKASPDAPGPSGDLTDLTDLTHADPESTDPTDPDGTRPAPVEGPSEVRAEGAPRQAQGTLTGPEKPDV